MSIDSKTDTAATEGCAAPAGYVAALEDALAAAIVSLYTTDKEDCLRTFHLNELEGALKRTQAITAETRLEDVYAKALRYPRPHNTELRDRSGSGTPTHPEPTE